MISTPVTRINHEVQIFSKVPEITLYFWVSKLLTTAMGEAISDYLVSHLNPYLAVCLGAAGFLAALALQLAVQRYIAWVYWLMVAMVSVFGTMMADVVHIVLGIPYALSSMIFTVALAIIFISWWRIEKTISIHSIHTRRREFFYWAAVIAAFALGTAAGDMTASTFHLGYSGSSILFTVLFAMPIMAFTRFGLNEIFTFWFAYVMTRPMGASFADWFDKPLSMGGLGYGDGLVSLVLTTLIVAVVAYLTFSRQDIKASSWPMGKRPQARRLRGETPPGIVSTPPTWGRCSVPRQ
ncbi:MAG: COG4705 family protein [Thiomonas sp.]